VANLRACFVSASGQNVFFEELLDALRISLVDLGVDTVEAVDHFPKPEAGLVFVFVPHEYLPLTDEAAHPTAAQWERTVALSTEQPGTAWFETVAHLAHRAGVTLDIHPLGRDELRRRGVPARLMRLGYFPGWDRWQASEESPRPIDLTFMGGYSERRGQTLARAAPLLVRRRAALHVYDTAHPYTSASSAFFSKERKWSHLSRSKLLLNIHRSENAYFEWQRVIGAVSNGCVVVTEHSLDYEPFVANENFISASIESLPHLADMLLADPDRLREMRQAAYRALRELAPMSASAEILAEALEDVRRRPLPASASVHHDPEPLPATPPRQPPEWEQLYGRLDDMDRLRNGMKNLAVANIELRRSIQRLAEQPRLDVDAPDQVQTLGPYEAANPRVSVIVTLFNLGRHIREALQSAAVSDYGDFEIVLVDDASTDDSLSVALDQLSSNPWVPAKVISRARNAGLPAGRNLALSHARGEFVFVLDADNTVYPHAFGRLVEGLDENPSAAFAYGMLEVFDARGSTDLASWGHWDPARFQYGNYIDAMAMLRTDVLREIGGYTTDRRLHGWEDFDLWCGFADSDLYGVLVPEILARYRSGIHSMISLTNIDTSEAWSALLERHPVLSETEGAAS